MGWKTIGNKCSSSYSKEWATCKPASLALCSANFNCSSERVMPVYLHPVFFTASIPRHPQPQPMSSNSWCFSSLAYSNPSSKCKSVQVRSIRQASITVVHTHLAQEKMDFSKLCSLQVFIRRLSCINRVTGKCQNGKLTTKRN